MAQNDNNMGLAIGLGFIAVIALVFFTIVILAIEIGALVFGGFALLVVNWRYKIIGLISGVFFTGLLGPLVLELINGLYRELQFGILVFAYQIAPFSLLAIGFLLAVFALDFVNDQRNLPTSDDDFIAWRIRWGFTKGLHRPEETIEHVPPLPTTSSKVFDVPPQERGS